MAKISKKQDFKVCGVTRLDDLTWCLKLGIPKIGFNLYPKSKRYVPLPEAIRLWREARAALTNTGDSESLPVVVMVDPDLRDVSEIVAKFPEVYAIQLHGHETDALIIEAKGVIGARELWQARRIKEVADIRIRSPHQVDLVLFDAPQLGSELGGTGVAFDWGLLTERTWSGRFGLAGGINPSNVGAALTYDPELIDVCSGVEINPGKKDIKAVEQIWTIIRGKNCN